MRLKDYITWRLKLYNFLNKAPKKILLVGDIMIDEYLWGNSTRISPEAPVVVVDVKNEILSLGGCGNVLGNLISLGSLVNLCTVIGDDSNSDFILKSLRDKNIDTKNVFIQKGKIASKKSRIISSNQQIVRYDKETKENITYDIANSIINAIKRDIKKCELVLLSDYGKGVLTKKLTSSIINIAKANNKMVLVDPKGKDYTKYSGATLITPNKQEASLASKVEIRDEDSLKEAGMRLKNNLSLKYAVITLSEDGLALFYKKMLKIPTVAKEVYDVTGAGDTVLASLGVALSLGADIVTACSFANSAAAVAVSKLGAVCVSRAEIFEYEYYLHKADISSKIVDLSRLLRLISKRDKKIVFTNGCFDILHIGHVKYLQKAKQFGGLLIVGLNSDASLKRLKGDRRPINTLRDRAYMLASLEFVDFVVEFGDDTPYELIKAIKPDVLTKGGDYQKSSIVGSDIVKDVRVIEFIGTISTTKLINKIRSK